MTRTPTTRPTATSKTLPAELRAFAEDNTGPLADVTNCSSPHNRSRVWKVTDRAGTSWYVKQHVSGKSHTREMTAYAQWTPALGPYRAPHLVAADPARSTILITALPGSTLFTHDLPQAEERTVHRQLGALLRAFHTAAPPHPPVTARPDLSAIDRKLALARPHLKPGEPTLIRQLATRLAALAPLPHVPTHGDAQLRNTLWASHLRRLALIDFERSEYGPAVRDLVRLEYGPWERRPELRDAFHDGYGQLPSPLETDVLRCMAALDALSGIVWGTHAGDEEVVARAHRTLSRLRLDTGL